MSHPTHLLRSFTPWRIAAVAIMAMTLSMSLWGHAEAAIGVTVTLNDNVAGNQTNLTVDITLDVDLNPGETITVTFPAGWVIANGDLTGSVSWSALQDVAPTITGNAAARTITTTTAVGQMAALPGLQMAIAASANVVNPAAPAAGLTITVDADNGNAQGTSAAFNIVAPAASAAVTGTIQGGANTEANIVTGGGTIIITLSNDTWVAAGATFDAQRQNIINGIDSAGAEGAGWDAVVKAGLAVTDVVRTSNTVVTVTLPAFAGYNITANETITVTIPATALTGNAQVIAAPTFNILAASVALTGTIQGGANTEGNIVTGGGTIILTLTNDTWVAAGATFDAQRQNIINGITSAGAEGTGWNTVVRDTLAVGAVVRTSATVVTVTLPAFGAYNITANETITVTVPATAIAGVGALTAAPTFTITSALPVSAAITGTIQGGANTEANIVTGGGTIIITLTNDTWVAAGGVFDAQRQNIINGIDSAGAEGAGWDAVVKAGLAVGAVVRTSATVVTVTLPAFGGYNIAANETVTVTIPATAVTGNAQIIAAPTFTITATAAPAAPIFAPTPVKCLPGTFSATGNTPCEPAPAGNFAAGPGATGYSQCQPGSFSTGGAASCTLAPIGFYAFGFGNTQALACPAGQTTRAPGAEFCTQLDALSDISLTSTNYRAGSTGVWTVEFTTSADGALEAGQEIFLRVKGVNLHGSNVGSVSLGGEFVYPPNRWVVTRSILSAVPDTIRFTLRAGEGASLAAGATGSLTFTMVNPTARTIAASDITVWTSVDTTPVAANAGVTITPRADAPKLTTLAVAPSDATSFSDIIPVTLVDGQIAYTVDVPAGKRYLVQGESTDTLTYYLGGEVVSTRLFDPNKAPIKSHAIGSTVTIRVENAAGVTTDYTVTLRTRPVGPPAKLAFITQPAGAVAGVAFTTQPRVAIQDANGQTTSSTDQMHLAIKPGTGTPGATLSCLPSPSRVDSRDAVAGIGTFTGCKIDRPGTGYVLVARPGTPLTFQLGTSIADDLGAAPLTVGESEPFNVTSATPTLATLSLVPTSASTGFSRIDVPVVPGQLVYEVNVPAFDAATRTPRYNISATMSDPAAQIRVAAFGQQWDPTIIALQSGETITFTGTNSAGTSATYTVRLRAQARPTLTTLVLRPLTAAGSIDSNVPFSDWPRADLTGGRTEFTLTVASGRSYGVTAQADSGEITYRRNGISFDPATTRLSAGDTVTIQVVNSAGSTSPTYTVTLRGPSTAVTGVTIAASPRAAGAATTITAVATYSTALVAADTITVKMTGYTFAAGSVQVTAGTGITGTLTGTVVAGALDTVVITGARVAAGASATFAFPATNPATAGTVARAGLTVHTSKDTQPVQSIADIVITRAGITGVGFSPSTTAAGATIALTAEFTTPSALAVGNAITLSVTDFVVPTSGLTVSASSGFSTGTTFAVASTATTITITVTGTAPANARLSLTVSGLKNPATAKTIAKAGLTVRTTPDTTAVASGADIVITRAGITGVGFSPSTTAADAAIALTAEFTTPSALATGNAITLSVTDFVVPTSGLSVSASSGFSTGTTFAVASTATTITITVTGTAPANTRLSLTVSGTGLKNPATAKTIAKAGLTVKTTPDTTAVAASEDIVITGPALTNAAVTLSNSTAGATGVTATVTFTTPVTIPVGGTIKVTLPGFAWPAAPNATFVSGTATATSAFAANVLTVTTATAAIPANSTVTLRVAGATLPAAQAAKTDVRMSVSSAAGAVLAETQTGTLVAITSPVTATKLTIVSTVPTTLRVGEAFTLRVAGQDAAGVTNTRLTGIATITTTPEGGLRGATMVTFANGIATFRLAFSAGGTYTITAATPGLTAASTRVTVAAAQPRLEFVTQPQDSTTGAADINVRVRAVKADGTTDTAFNNQVQLSIQGGGSSFGLGSVTAVNGVATFTRTYNPSRADATWTLRASQISGRAAGVYAPATSDSFRVSALPTLRFTTQPSDGTAGAALTTQPVVTAYKADGTVDTAFTGTVTLTLKADTANGAVLTSTATAAVAGVATFAGVSVNNAGTDYVLVASATGYANVASDSFDVTSTATQIVMTQYPSTFAAGRDYTIEVRAEARDAEGRVVPSAASQLGLVLTSGRDGTTRMLTTPTRVEDGVAVFSLTHRFTSGGSYRWHVDAPGNNSLELTMPPFFTVAKPASKLAFVVQPGGFGSTLGTQPVVEIQDEDGNRVPGATNEVTLTFVATNDTDPIMTGGARRAATAGRVTYTAVGFTGGTARPGSTFTITASATGLISATSASFGPAGPTTKLAFTSDLPCGLVARPGCSPAAREGQQFTITVAAQDASGQLNPNENGLVTLTSDGNSGMAAKSAPFVNGVATFTGVSFTSPSTTGYTLTATAGALTVASGRIVVTRDNTPASIRFTSVPTHLAKDTAFTAQIEVLNAAGQRITDATGTVVLTLGKQGGTTTSVLTGTLRASVAQGIAKYTDLKVGSADTGLYLVATMGTLTGTQTGTFRVYADAASATTARLSEQTQSKPFSLRVNVACTLSACQRAVQDDICKALQLAANCTRVSVTSVSSSSIVIEITDASLITTANVEVIDGQEIITLGGLDLVAFQAEFGAQPPAGTSALYAVARIASDEYGNRLEELSAPQSFSLPVPESVLLPGARPGDLKVAWWDGEQWVQVPTRAVVEEDGSFRVTATSSHLGAFAVLYAPGASRIDTSGVFSANGVGSGVFVGGSTAALAHAAGLNDATTLWVQDASGTFRVLVIGGPAFLAEQFASHFADGFAGPTPVTLVRASASPVTSVSSGPSGTTSTPTARPTSSATTSATTHTVAPGETLSRIGARYGVEWMRIAEANGITGPDYAIRDGLVLTIPV